MANQKTKTPKKLIRFFYITTPDLETAQKISKTLLDEKLIACSNILPQMESQYRWQGEIESAKECVLILKSTSNHAKTLLKRVPELHPYENPCIVEIAIESAAKAYADWLMQQVKA